MTLHALLMVLHEVLAAIGGLVVMAWITVVFAALSDGPRERRRKAHEALKREWSEELRDREWGRRPGGLTP